MKLTGLIPRYGLFGDDVVACDDYIVNTDEDGEKVVKPRKIK